MIDMHLLIVEDDRRIASFLSRALEEEGHVVDVVHDGLAGEAQARSTRYDVILLDWMLPGADGLTVCRALRSSGNAVPVLMLTARDEVSERVLGLDAGADDYLVKPFALEELLARVRALGRRRGASDDATVVATQSLSLDRLRRTVSDRDGRRVELTGREFTLLEYLIRHAGRVVTRTELLQHVWGLQHDPGTNVVDVYVRKLRDKLGSMGSSISTARGVGYVLEV